MGWLRGWAFVFLPPPSGDDGNDNDGTVTISAVLWWPTGRKCPGYCDAIRLFVVRCSFPSLSSIFCTIIFTY